MNLAIVQPVAHAAGPRARAYGPARAYRDEVALLAACLRRDGHTVSLSVVLPGDALLLAEALADQRPDLVLMYAEGLTADPAVRVAGAVGSALGAPLVVFGPHARRCPDACLSLAGAEAVAVTAADRVVPPYLQARAERVDSLRSAGLWITCETGVMRNPAPQAPASLEDEPPPARNLYTSDRVLDAAGFAPIVAARGGEAAGGEPPPGTPAGLAAAAPHPGPPLWPVLHRPLEAVLREMQGVARRQLDLGGWYISNTRWASGADWLAAFAGRYPRQVGLPIRTTLRAADVTAQSADLLARAGCEEVRLPLGSASHLIRTEALGIDASPEAVEAAVAALRQVGVRSAVSVQVGAPYETEITLEETVALLRRIDPDRVEARLHWPEPGSASERIARENGWLVPDPASAYPAGRPAVVTPSLSPGAILEARDLLPYRVLRPRMVPLLRLARRVRIPRKGSAYEWLVEPLLVPPLRKG